MLTMALVALLGLGVIAFLYFFFVGRGSAQRTAVQVDLEAEVAGELHRPRRWMPAWWSTSSAARPWIRRSPNTTSSGEAS